MSDRSAPRLHSRVLSHEGPPMIMLHGLLTGSIASWYLTVAPAFTPHYEVVLYDQRGHGRSERTQSGYDLCTMSNDLASIIGDRPRVVLVGHSYGALIALRYAIDFPERVASLIMVEPPLGSVKRRLGWSKALLKSAPLGDAGVARRGRAQRRLADRVTALLDDTNLAEDVLRQPRFRRQELQGCATRALTVFGSESPNVHLVDQMRLMPYNTIEVIPGMHDLHLTAADQLCRIFAAFLALDETTSR